MVELKFRAELPLGLDVPDQLLSNRGARDPSERRRQALVPPGEFLQVREPPAHDTSRHRDRRVEDNPPI